MEPLTIIFIGPQGSGKGTQIEKLREVMAIKDPLRRVVDIQTGRRFRALAARHETFAERKVATTLDTGVLQPDFLTHILWGQAMLDQLDPLCHLLIDGFPRTVIQAHVLEDALTFFERPAVHVINLEAPDEVVRTRMQERARADDTPDSIENRLRWYYDETMPVLAYYRGRPSTHVHNIDATATVAGVHDQIVAALNLH